MTLAGPAHAVFLACGCPCSLVFAPDAVKAMRILFGPLSIRPVPPRRSCIRPVDGPSVHAVVRQLQAAPGRRFTCRSAHHLAGE